MHELEEMKEYREQAECLALEIQELRTYKEATEAKSENAKAHAEVQLDAHAAQVH